MVNWKTSITPIYIQNHDIHKKICMYNVENGAYVEKERTEFPELKETWRGFYKNANKDIIGIFATDKGPVFFVNDVMYLLTEKDWDFKVETLQDINLFTFLYDGKEQYRIQYQRTKDIGVHAYADEEFMDFFVWMAKKKESKTFIGFYTLNQ